MSSSEFIETNGSFQPRACRIKRRMTGEVRNDGMLISIDPPIIGQPFGLGDKDINELIIFSRHAGYTLFPLTNWPIHVYAYRIINPAIRLSGKFTKEDVEMVMWAEIYPTLESIRS